MLQRNSTGTVERPKPPMEVATLRQRALAFLLDYLAISAYLVVLVIAGVGLGTGLLKEQFAALFADPNRSEATAFVLLVLPVILWFTFFEHSAWQGSWGKRRLGLMVSQIDGTRLSWGRSFARSLLKFAPWELAHACLWRIPGWPLAATAPSPLITAGLVLVWVIAGAYLVSALVNDKRQTLYDRVVGSYVINAGGQ